MQEGKRLYEGQCAVCHGIGGAGSSGPSLQRPKLPRAGDQAAMELVIANGIEGTAMPGAWQMSPREVRDTAAYVLSIGRVASEPNLPGDAAKGKEVYRKTGCANCHIVDGAGNGYGPELTLVGLKRSAAHLRQSIVEPAADVPGEFLSVAAVPAQGPQVVGVRVNEDSFSIQIRDMSGRHHSFQKPALKSLDKGKQSMMPAFDKLAAGDLENLVKYLSTLRGGGEDK